MQTNMANFASPPATKDRRVHKVAYSYISVTETLCFCFFFGGGGFGGGGGGGGVMGITNGILEEVSEG